MRFNTLLHTLLTSALLLAAPAIYAQCTTGVAPSYSAGCTSQYFTSITASGTGVTSTISYSGSSCAGSYFNFSATQGIIAPAGGTVTMPISRITGYAAYVAVYVDWNNNGTFETTELAGTTAYLATGVGSTSYNFTIPVTGVTTGVNLPMRVYLGEPHYAGGTVSAPCSAWWGQSNDYYCKIICPLTTITATAAPTAICIGGTASLTASGADTGGTYSWSPATGLSAIAGSSITTTTSTTTTYTVTGTDVTGCVGTATATVTVNPLPVAAITPIISSLCTGGSVSLTATPGTAYTYQWYNGATAISGATDGVYIAAPAASTTYSATVTTPEGCSATLAAATVSVYPFPSAVVTASGSLALCAGNTVTLSAVPGAGYTYQWYNGSTAISGATNATWNTGTAGNYSVMITGPGSCNSSSAVQVVTVNPLPVAFVTTTTGTPTFCAGDSVIFTASAGTGYTYQWSNAAGAIAGATDITYTAHAAGTYSATITDGYGCSAMAASASVVVNPLPITTITTPGYTSVCFPNSILLSATTGAGYSYQWYNGVPAIAGATNATYNAAASGFYSVRITNGTTGCTAVTTGASIISITIRPKPTATITSSATMTRFCSYDSVVLTGPSASGYTYQWRTSGTSIAGATNATYTVHSTGIYRLIVTNGSGCSDTTSTPITDTVDIAPVPGVTTSGAITFCAGGSVTLSASAVVGYTYQWYTSATASGAGTAISGATNATYNTGTTAYYHVVITSLQGCITSSVVTLVTAVPKPVALPSGPTTFCEGGNVGLSVPAAPGAGYQWKRNGSPILGATSPIYVATSTGYYNCFVNLPGACASFSDSVYVLVHPAPVPVITFNGVMLKTYNFYTSYQWYINTVTIPGATTNSTPATTNAGYRVLVTDTNGCNRMSDEYHIFNLAVDNVNATAAIHIYPNPATDIIYVDMPAHLQARLLSTDGRMLTEGKEMNISQLPAGMYMVVVVDERGMRVVTEKVVKQ